MKRFLLLFSLLLGIGLGGCNVNPLKQDTAQDTTTNQAAADLAEHRLLDVWIETFDPGEVEDDEDENSGLSNQIRNAEAYFIPVHLKKTMQATGHWGAVRAAPRGTSSAEVLVKGRILESNGLILELNIEAFDASGARWFNRDYQGEAEHRTGLEERGVHDPFQHVYNKIANDLAAYKAELEDTEVRNIRTLSQLRFAADFAPDPFAEYVSEIPGSSDPVLWELRRLPAEEDPLYQKVLSMRERDNLLIDTLDQYFGKLYDEIWEPYLYWRENRVDEAEARDEIQSSATTRKLLGLAAIVGAIAVQVADDGNSAAGDILSSVLVVGGVEGIKSGFEKEGELGIHDAALRELGESLETEVTPMVIKTEGQTVKLTGTADTIYKKWRALMQRLYLMETGAIEVEAHAL